MKTIQLVLSWILLIICFSACEKSDSVSPTTTGTGGSLARFAITGDFLYAVGATDLRVFNITSPDNPIPGNTIKLGFGIETIFPYKDKLFIGTQTGMKIYDNALPQDPKFISEFVHIASCDPVVVQGSYAYVTLRDGTACRRGVNRLDVVDIQNITQPKLVNSIAMQNPHGLGVDGNSLYVCDGLYGLKVMDLTKPEKPEVTTTFPELVVYDVIPNKKTLIMTGRDGIFQYGYKNGSTLQQLSKLPVE